MRYECEEIKLREEGSYEIDRKVVIALIKKALGRLEGVYAIKRSLFGERVKVKQSGEKIRISLELIIKEGSSIPQVVEETQKEIKEEIQKTLNRAVDRVDIKIKKIKAIS